jgi:hypothetical protein
VRFTNGRTEDVLAGHATFVPALQTVNAKAHFKWNTTFTDSDCYNGDYLAQKKRSEDMEKCLPEAERSIFVAEITLEEGNVVQKGMRVLCTAPTRLIGYSSGQPLKGRVTIHTIRNGSTTMSDISIDARTVQRPQWAHEQAAAGGDAEFYNATSGLCQPGTGRALDAESELFNMIFNETDDYWRTSRNSKNWEIPLTPAHPYFDFELPIPRDTPIDFASYYTVIENLLQVRLNVLYSPDVAKCIKPDSREWIEDETLTADDAEKVEEGLWNTYVRVGQPISDSKWSRTLRLGATVPITIVGTAKPARAVTHYLTPGAAAPVLQSGSQPKVPALFPVAQPVFTVEALANTSARLMQPGSTDPVQVRQQFMNMTRFNKRYPDPAQDYRPGEFAGLLWKKKIVAEERGIWPVRTEVVDGGDGQQPLSVSL